MTVQKTYQVEYVETVRRVIVVKAGSRTEATRIVQDMAIEAGVMRRTIRSVVAA